MTDLFFPVILNKGKKENYNPCGMNGLATQVADMLINSDWQQRPRIICHPLLVLAAQNKADEMAVRDYLSHTNPDGVTANENVRLSGYRLPDWYELKGNNVESWAFGYDTVERAIAGLLKSPTHRNHIAGESNFYRSQECFGVGVTRKHIDQPYSNLFVIVTAHCPES